MFRGVTALWERARVKGRALPLLLSWEDGGTVSERRRVRLVVISLEASSTPLSSAPSLSSLEPGMYLSSETFRSARKASGMGGSVAVWCSVSSEPGLGELGTKDGVRRSC